jgi:hypothetical protein
MMRRSSCGRPSASAAQDGRKAPWADSTRVVLADYEDAARRSARAASEQLRRDLLGSLLGGAPATARRLTGADRQCGWSPTKNSNGRCSRRLPRETSEPGTQAARLRHVARQVRRDRAVCLPGCTPASIDAAFYVAAAHKRGEAIAPGAEKDFRDVAAVWVPHGIAETTPTRPRRQSQGDWGPASLTAS